MAYVLVEDGKVIQKRPDYREGFIEAPEHVVPGYLCDKETGDFCEPDTSPTKEEKIRVMKERLQRIDSEYNTDRGVREYIINNSGEFNKYCVDRMQAAEDKVQKIRDELRELIG